MSDKIVKEIEREDMNEKDKGKGDLYLGHVFPLFLTSLRFQVLP